MKLKNWQGTLTGNEMRSTSSKKLVDCHPAPGLSGGAIALQAQTPCAHRQSPREETGGRSSADKQTSKRPAASSEHSPSHESDHASALGLEAQSLAHRQRQHRDQT